MLQKKKKKQNETNNHYGVKPFIVEQPSSDMKVVDAWSAQTKGYKIAICCFSANHAAWTRKSKDWLAGKQDNVSE